mmetsp:Transcript_57982/g.169524  ORF Transcript_57982/g.169524 Transcript_57982/m.169524 type:complete len:280 (+) Transcript_57982:850-1689(+)
MAPPTFSLITLTLSPPLPMKSPTKFGATTKSSSSGGISGAVPSGGIKGQPFVAKTSRITASVFSTFPMIVTSPSGSSRFEWSILMSAPVFAMMSRIVPPPLPRSTRICTDCSRSTFTVTGGLPTMPGCGWVMSLSQSGTVVACAVPGVAPSSHLLLRRLASFFESSSWGGGDCGSCSGSGGSVGGSGGGGKGGGTGDDRSTDALGETDRPDTPAPLGGVSLRAPGLGRSRLCLLTGAGEARPALERDSLRLQCLFAGEGRWRWPLPAVPCWPRLWLRPG